MTRTRRLATAGLTVVGLGAALMAPLGLTSTGGSASASTQAAPSLFGAAPASSARQSPDLSRGAVERSRYVSLRDGVLPRSASGQRVDLPFFSDADFTATIEHVDHQALFTSWSGPLNEQYGTFVATRTGDQLTVLANTLHGNYMLSRSADGAYQVTQTTPVNNQVNDEIGSDQQMAQALAASAPTAGRSSAAAAPNTGRAVLAPADSTVDRKKKKGSKGDDGSVMDILVGYTASAAAAYGGTAGIVNEAAYNIAITNAAYANSGVPTSVRLVGVVPVSGTEVGSSNLVPDLNAFTKKGDGKFDEIFKYIKRTHADDSILLEAPYVEGTSYCGLAWQYHNQPKNRAFAVMATGRCTDGQPTFPHEFGHNMGAVHDYYTEHDGGFGSNGTKPQFPYGYGYVAPNCAFMTIMSYQDECIQTQGIYVQPILNYSNPAVFSGGQTTGTASREDVAKLIAKDRKRVARHNQSQLYPRSSVRIKPKPRLGQRVSVKFKGWVNSGVKTKVRWYRDGKKIKHANKFYYRPTRKDVGKRLAVVLTGKKRHYAPVAVGSGSRKVKKHKGRHHRRTTASSVVVGGSVVRPASYTVALSPASGWLRLPGSDGVSSLW